MITYYTPLNYNLHIKDSKKMIHTYKKGVDPSQPTLVLLHGTGGDENDLIPLGKRIDPRANLLSIRGEVSEQGMLRFFKRLSPGVFDEEDLMYRTQQLFDFIKKAAEMYHFDSDNVWIVGYSNGANIAANMLLTLPNVCKGAMLLHPMLPRKIEESPSLKQCSIYLTAGKADPIVPLHSIQALETALIKSGANVSLEWFQHGHQLHQDEVNALITWYNKNSSPLVRLH
jgi:phospholipase/carboxylesterase